MDRENIQKEMDSLKDEIDRISEGTNFNGIKLLDGSMGNASSGASYKLAADDATSQIKAFEATITGQAGLQVEFKAAAAGAHGVTAAWSGDKISITTTGKTGGADSFTEKEINDAIAKATGTKPEGASSINVKIKNGKIDSSAATEAGTVGNSDTLAESKYYSYYYCWYNRRRNS